VDDAIVMLENIHRHIEAGMNRFEAAMKGAKEIGFAVVAMTITLVAVFTPLVFITGRVGQLFVEFALTVVSAVLVSGFVALTLTPMMCSILLKRQENHGPAYKMSELVFEKINNGYGAILRVILRGWYVVVGSFV
ncbi:MAG TPA: multidrug transporter AcrB, partial [Betaproteobacteria bacterium]|nr:multidrug transporter AcrB [Betaproteobacteria bacterium]